MERYDAEVEWALMNNIEPADHIAALTRVPANPVRLSPEQAECPHPLETISFEAYLQVLRCGQCGGELPISEIGGE